MKSKTISFSSFPIIIPFNRQQIVMIQLTNTHNPLSKLPFRNTHILKPLNYHLTTMIQISLISCPHNPLT
ncbi:hypothetical protein HanRHA438_Chr08g0333611 [Helianthus annuus]|nr:hypothetical protein HanRHA438_Chr08g0333611 [Helianthus annuus]